MMCFGGIIAATSRSGKHRSYAGSTRGSCGPSRHGRFKKPSFSMSFIDALKDIYEQDHIRSYCIITPDSCNDGYLYMVDPNLPHKLLRIDASSEKVNYKTGQSVLITAGIMMDECCTVFTSYSAGRKFINKWKGKL